MSDNVFENEAAIGGLQENLRSAHSKIAEMELDNREYARKLQESENLMYDLQKALAHANDLAMQKALEATRSKRNLEKKIEKLLKENKDLKQGIFFASSPKPEEPKITHVTTKTFSSTSAPMSPITRHRTQSGSSEKSTDIVDSTPLKLPSAPVTVSRNGSFKSQQSSRSLLSTESNQNSRPISPPPSPRMSASKRLEQDLSQQLRELLDITNEISSPMEEDRSSSGSMESVAPPKPPPPVHYDSKERRYGRCV